MLNSNYTEQDWESAMRYGEEHAAEFAEYGVEVAPRLARSEMGHFLFGMACDMNRALAEQLRLRGGGR